jgi:sucrose-6-phosphate hydrolase SacC (GH32 family)
VFEGLDPDTKAFSLSAPNVRRIGGKVDPAGFDTLALRIILDHSLLEVFTGSGQVVTTRVYRGQPATPEDTGIDFLSFGGSAELASMHAWELESIWSDRLVRH